MMAKRITATQRNTEWVERFRAIITGRRGRGCALDLDKWLPYWESLVKRRQPTRDAHSTENQYRVERFRGLIESGNREFKRMIPGILRWSEICWLKGWGDSIRFASTQEISEAWKGYSSPQEAVADARQKKAA